MFLWYRAYFCQPRSTQPTTPDAKLTCMVRLATALGMAKEPSNAEKSDKFSKTE